MKSAKFIEKDKDTFESTIYSLADFGSTDVRNDQNYLLNYFKGKYGTLPYIDFSRLFNEEVKEEEKCIVKPIFVSVKASRKKCT